MNQTNKHLFDENKSGKMEKSLQNCRLYNNNDHNSYSDCYFCDFPFSRVN